MDPALFEPWAKLDPGPGTRDLGPGTWTRGPGPANAGPWMGSGPKDPGPGTWAWGPGPQYKENAEPQIKLSKMKCL